MMIPSILPGAGGARVAQREFDNFSAHKNWALDTLIFGMTGF